MTSKSSLGLKPYVLLPCSGIEGSVDEGHLYKVIHIDGPTSNPPFLPLEECYEEYGEKNCSIASSRTQCPDCSSIQHKNSLEKKISQQDP